MKAQFIAHIYRQDAPLEGLLYLRYGTHLFRVSGRSDATGPCVIAFQHLSQMQADIRGYRCVEGFVCANSLKETSIDEGAIDFIAKSLLTPRQEAA